MQKEVSRQVIEIFINSFESLSISSGVDEYQDSMKMRTILKSKQELVDEIVEFDINQEMVGASWFVKTGDKSDHRVHGLREKIHIKYDLVKNDPAKFFVLP
jgi:hypothetical protein